ncbi:MAG: hypothetical protein EHM58_14120 [Ignavibacteriae bacterium]|nr:MAG: hypothetical protein EHM58_14120 [Ignavibacteriota bacterium]
MLLELIKYADNNLIKMFSRICLILLFIFTTGLYAQQSGTLYGTISSFDGTNVTLPIEGAVITITSGSKFEYSSESEENGSYVINNIAPGTYKIRVEMGGYKPAEKSGVAIAANDSLKLNFYLSGDSYTTDEIDIISERFKQAQNDMRTSLMNLSPRTSKTLPGAGEDVLRSLQSLPGVTAPNDYSSQLVVRGSGPDQNLIIMDDVEIFNPYRLYGAFSMFNPETLSEINLITGGFPSRYGDRLSAVLDVTNKEGNRSRNITG